MARKLSKIPLNILFSLALFLATTVLVNIENRKRNQQVLGIKTQVNAQPTVGDWEQILEERPDYFDGWIHLAATYYSLGEKQKAREALQRAKLIDPTNETLLALEKLLEN